MEIVRNTLEWAMKLLEATQQHVYRGRLVVQRREQVPDIDYGGAFAPGFRLQSIRIVASSNRASCERCGVLLFLDDRAWIPKGVPQCTGRHRQDVDT